MESRFILKPYSVEKTEEIVIDNSAHYKTTLVVHNKRLVSPVL